MIQSAKIRVLVVDDSALMRKKISDMINSDDGCEVIAIARNGEEAINSIFALKPDVVTLDIDLPKMDGITALKYIMSEWPVPVVIVTGLTKYSGQETIKCLEYGAVDLVIKPSGVISLDIESVKNELLSKIKAASKVNLKILHPILIEKPPVQKKTACLLTNKIIVIASSTGGPRALAEILPELKADLPAGVIVVQHMPEGFTNTMAERLNWESDILVKEAQDDELINQGKVLIAPGGFHLTIESMEGAGEAIKLQKGPKEHGVCPSADIMMKSAAALYQKNCLGVILTGMGSDGVDGLREIKKFGGSTIAEDEMTSIIYGMPKAAFDAGVADKVLPLSEIAEAIMQWARL
ncbi:MAG: chemotaxis response regulator protein-glutamate methylesterase [Candidatus Omnitrophota bacterium]